MQPRFRIYFTTVAVFAALAFPSGLAAQEQASRGDSLVSGKVTSEAAPRAARLGSLPSEAQAGILAQLAKLTASDGAPFDYLGYSVAIDGDTVVVGTWLEKVGSNYEQGAAYVFVKPQTGWANMTETAKLTASDGAAGDQFGYSVSISGNTVVAGSFATIGSNVAQGAAYVFVKPPSGWTSMTETAKLTASDGTAFDALGASVSISGNTIAVGEFDPLIANGINAGTAAAYVFVKPQTGWANVTQTAELTGSDTTLSDAFGLSISISGNTVAVGAHSATTSGFNQFQGAVYVFVEPASGWVNTTQTAKLTASNSSYAEYLGASVAISGNTIVGGAPGSGLGRGAAYVFVEPARGWANGTETAELTGGKPGDISGYSVGMSDSTIVVGAPRWPAYNGPGAVYVFGKPKSGWKSTSHFNSKLAASDGATNDYLGFSVSISGNTIVSGAYGADIGANTDEGEAYVFSPSVDSDLRLAQSDGVVENAVEAPGNGPDQAKETPHYKLIDLGTFGGPNSYLTSFARVLNNNSLAAAYADTATPDPFPAFCFNPDCYVSHALLGQNGIVTDLGALPGGGSSQAEWINDTGLIAGVSQNGQIDPLIPGFPEFRAVLWQDDNITDLGTLEGGYESLGLAVNDHGQVVGPALNTVPDPYCLFATGFCTTQTRAFLWENGVMQDLGTLGGPDAFAVGINDSGTVLGFSYTSYNPGPTGVPPIDPFLWNHGNVIDLGTLGGTASFPNSFNTHSQVVGQSNLAGDVVFRPFLWERGNMTDLGTFLGPGPPSYGIANWINDAGEIVGWADNQKSDFPALWKDGEINNLGTVAGDSCAYANNANSKGQVVGRSALCGVADAHAFVWEHDGPITDLNTLVPSTSGVHLTNALFINDNGEIAAVGLVNNGDQHAFVLIPCDENHPGVEGCDFSLVDVPVAAGQTSPTVRNASSAAPSRVRQRPFGRHLMPWYRGIGAQPMK